jgi:TolB-like protein
LSTIRLSIIVVFLGIAALLGAQSKPKIAVLPVDIVLNGDAGNRQNVDQLTQELALEMSRRGNEVLPPVQTSAVKDEIMNAGERWQRIAMQPADIQAVGEKLDVGYVVAGSLTRAGTNNVYHAWLYDTETGDVRASNSIESKTISDGLTMARLLAGWLLNDAAPLHGPTPAASVAAASPAASTASPAASTASATPAASTASPAASTASAAPAASLSIVPQPSNSDAPSLSQTPTNSTQSWPPVNNVPSTQTVPWTSIITQPAPTATNPVVPQVSPSNTSPVTSAPSTTQPSTAQPSIVGNSSASPSVVVNITPSQAGAVPSMPLVFNNNNNNNNNNVIPSGGGGSGGSQQQQQQQSDSSPIIINEVERPQNNSMLLLLPQQESTPATPVVLAPPENPPAEPVVITVATETLVETRKIFYFGIRVGVNLPQYARGASSDDEATEETNVVDSGGMFGTIEPEGALFFGIQIANWLAFQIDGIYTMTSALASGEEPIRIFKSNFDLMIAAQLKLTFRPGIMLIAPFGGAYIGLYPMNFSTTRYENGDLAEDAVAISTPVANPPIYGWTAGLTLGIKLGPGDLFFQGQVYGDLVDTRLRMGGEDDLDAYIAHRRTLMPSFTLGYQIPFGTVKKTVQPEAK